MSLLDLFLPHRTETLKDQYVIDGMLFSPSSSHLVAEFEDDYEADSRNLIYRTNSRRYVWLCFPTHGGFPASQHIVRESFVRSTLIEHRLFHNYLQEFGELPVA